MRKAEYSLLSRLALMFSWIVISASFAGSLCAQSVPAQGRVAVAPVGQSEGRVSAQTLTGVSVLPSNVLNSYSVYGASSSGLVTVSQAGLPFTQAIELQRATAGQFDYSAGLGWTIARNIPLNDLLVLTFWVKNTNSDLHVLHLRPVLQDAKTYDQSLSTNAPVDIAGWQKYVIPFRANQIYQVNGNGAQLEFFFGDTVQSLELGGIQLQDYGQVGNPLPSALTSTFSFYYPSRTDAKAAWRIAAASNIAKTRMAQLQVNVTMGGKAVANAAVTVNQTASAFQWGSAVSGCNVAGRCLSAQNTALYNANIVKNFNTVVLENDLKWPNWECCRQDSTDGIAFAKKNKLALRGHNLIWPCFQWMPSDTSKLGASALTTRIHDHFVGEEGALKGVPYEWDVVNEPYTCNQVQGLIAGVTGVTPSQGVLGNTAIANWYALAATTDSHPVLNLNDYNIFESREPKHEAYDLALVKYIHAQGASVGGFGFESHFGQAGPIFSEMQATLNDLDPLIPKYGATEFDFTLIDPALQADLTRDYMTFIFGQPKFNEFLMWGFWDGAHWLNSAPLYNLNWSLKPSGKVYQTLTQQTWQTHTKGTTSVNGSYAVRAFKGSYSITAVAGGKTCTVPVQLTADKVQTIKLECP